MIAVVLIIAALHFGRTPAAQCRQPITTIRFQGTPGSVFFYRSHAYVTDADGQVEVTYGGTWTYDYNGVTFAVNGARIDHMGSSITWLGENVAESATNRP